MKTETITWHELPADGMPDAELTVLISTERDGVESGWFDGTDWRWCESGGIVAEPVQAWAEMPEGVQPGDLAGDSAQSHQAYPAEGDEPHDSRGPTSLEGWRSAALAGEKEREYLRERLATVDRHQGKDCWYWQNDGEDHLESMTNTLPVVIRADHLRALLAQPQPKGAERTSADYALEFAEYMAKGAERLIEAVNALAEAEQRRDEGSDDPLLDLDDLVNQAREDCTEFLTGLRDDIYQFRTRRDRAAREAVAAQSPAPAHGLEVSVGRMSESNGRKTWMVMLQRQGAHSLLNGHQVYSSHIEGRAQYEAAALRHFLGQGPEPDILDFDTDGAAQAPAVGERIAGPLNPHPIADIICAWANGFRVEFRYRHHNPGNPEEIYLSDERWHLCGKAYSAWSGINEHRIHADDLAAWQAFKHAAAAHQPVQVPLNEDQLNALMLKLGVEMRGLRCWGWMDLVRAVEVAHGIGSKS